jgi:gamma-glutamyltranspeptidase
MAARAILVGEDLRLAQAAPRWVIPDFGPGTGSTLQMEPGAPESTVEALRRLGHRIDLLPERQPGFGPVSVIDLRGPVDAAADPRVETSTALVF